MVPAFSHKRRAYVVARELGSLVIAFAVWSGLALAIVAFAWRPTSIWWYVLLPLYLPAPVAAFLYVLLVHPATRGKSAQRGVFLAALGWVLASPIPNYPLFTQFLKVFEFFHTVPTAGEAPHAGVFYGSVASFWAIGIFYCGYSGYWAGRLADHVLEEHNSIPRTRETRD